MQSCILACTAYQLLWLNQSTESIERDPNPNVFSDVVQLLKKTIIGDELVADLYCDGICRN
jgi:hypothetical protein